MHKSGGRWGWGLLALAAPWVAAQTAPEPGLPILTTQAALPTVEVTGNYDTGVGSSDAASAGSATGTLLQNRPLLRPGEVLELVPGMIVTQHSGDGKANQYFLRGFNLDHGTDFAAHVDGVPANLRSHAHGQGYTDLNFVIPETVARIDYVKGPYFAQEGDFASAGAARLMLANTLEPGLASLTLGAHAYQRAVLAKSHDFSGGKLLYGLELGHNNGPWENPEKFRKFNALLRHSTGPASDSHTLTAMGYQARWNATDQIPQRAVEAGRIGRYGAIDPSDGGESSRYSLAYARRLAVADGVFKFNAYYVQSRLKLFSNFTYALDDTVQGDQFNQAEQRRMFGFDLAKTWLGKLGGIGMENTLGLQSRYDRLAPVGLYNTVARQQVDVVRQDGVRELSAGVYLENVMRWLPGFRSVAGLRYDAYRFAVDSSIPGNSGKVSAGITSPKLSLIFGPLAQTEVFANYGEGFHSNDARGTTQTQLPKGGGATAPVTPLVKTRGAELGVRTEIIPGLQSSLAVWHLRIASELLFVGDAGATAPSRPSRRSGIEWNNHYVAGLASFEARLDLDVALSRARYTQDDPAGNEIPGALGKVVSAGISLSDRKRWSWALQLRYFGPRPLVEDNSVRSSSTTLAYLRVAYQVAPQARLSLDIYNLFNRKASDIDYFYASQLRGEAGPVSDRHFHPVEPRALRLTLQYRY